MLVSRRDPQPPSTLDLDLERPRERERSAAPRASVLLDGPRRQSPELVAFYASLHAKVTDATFDVAVASRSSAGREAIDAKRDAYAGPYKVEGDLVSAPPMFKMFRAQPSQERVGDLHAIVGRDLAQAVQSGQAPPRAIVKATQKLIDAGKLPPPPGDVATRIKQMQWQYGVGIDCACFTRQCLSAVTGKSDAQLGLDRDQGLRGLDGNAHFTKLDVTEVRAGDVITLDPKPPETVGHNVIVRDHVIADTARKKEIGVAGPVARSFMASVGPHHVIEVDSAWGAGADGATHGGYRRDTWILDESTRVWGHFQPGSGVFLTSKDGPAELDRFHGAYRAKGT